MSSLFSGPPKPPAPPAPTPMPDLMDPSVLAAKQRAASAASTSSGRASTVLTGGSGDYSGTKLGTP